MQSLRFTVVIIILGVMLLPLVAYILPMPKGLSPGSTRTGVASLFVFASVHFGAAVLFLVGLQGFKDEFKKAYRYISAGVVLQGISALALPLVTYAIAWKSAAMAYLTNLLYALGLVLVYIGLRKFARLLEIKHPVMHTSFPVALAGLIAAILWYLPHTSNAYGTELQFNLAQVVVGLELTLCITVVWLAVHLGKIVGATYRQAVGWFAAAVSINLFAATAYIAKDFGALPAWATDSIVGIPYLVGGIVYMAAAYKFALISHQAYRQADPDATLIDCVIFTASLASNPRAIDPLLDTLRVITAKMSSGSHTLGPLEREKIMALYRELENYLIAKEPVRRFTRDSLRREIAHRFIDVPWSTAEPKPV